jgi:hypothetical protein
MWHLLYSEDPSVSPPVLSIFIVFCADECVRLKKGTYGGLPSKVVLVFNRSPFLYKS